MSKRELVRIIQQLTQQIRKLSHRLSRSFQALFRAFLVSGRKPRKGAAPGGFVLPTVAMVTIVVILLTTAILFRSFERSQNASNVRVNQAVLKAATPALDRAKSKITQLFNDPTLPRSTPSDTSLYNAFSKNIKKYTFGDETPLEISYDLNGNGTIDVNDSTDPNRQLPLENREKISTGWRFPVDSDNNGKFDSYTLYNIVFRSPPRSTNANATDKFTRPRSPLDARTPPMDDGSLGSLCTAATGTSASLIGESGWYKSGANIKKSFFVYTANVPIETGDPNLADTRYEPYQGRRGFSALEYQQDQERTTLISNAVVYEDDLFVNPGPPLRINGSVFTNSNLFATSLDGVSLYLVSSPKSCFYKEENNKVIVGGNVGNGSMISGGEDTNVRVDLFKPEARDGGDIGNSSINRTNSSASNTVQEIAYNSQAYAQRINYLVQYQLGQAETSDPTEVKDEIRRLVLTGTLPADARRQALETYFKDRTRRVPLKEVPLGGDALAGAGIAGSGDTLRPPDAWILPTDANTTLTLNRNQLQATNPKVRKEDNKGEEKLLGDRIQVGNNLPGRWWNGTLFADEKLGQKVGVSWTAGGGDRERFTQVNQVISLAGVTDRNGLIEKAAAERPKNPLDNAGGLRVVTGAGIYIDGLQADPNSSYPRDNPTTLKNLGIEPYYSQLPNWDKNFVVDDVYSTPPDIANPDKVALTSLRFNNLDPIAVRPDTMSMGDPTKIVGDTTKQTGDPKKIDSRGDLLMRASAVYHYAQADVPPVAPNEVAQQQSPIACVSNYYDPTNAFTALNSSAYKGTALNLDSLFRYPYAQGATQPPFGKSNNGISYPPPFSPGGRNAALATYQAKLTQQARLVFPDGRVVNQPLRDALLKAPADRRLPDNSAIDAAICAIRILEDTAFTPNDTVIPHGSIFETAFLDARQVKSIEAQANVTPLASTAANYTRSVEERQPLEVRTTTLDLDKLRTRAYNPGGGNQLRPEYLIPNSGIVYATRDDALPDLSDSRVNGLGQPKGLNERKSLSPTDYKLDPTRRPNGIMLINGRRLDRTLRFRDEEKGFILATDLPAYVLGDFNLHSKGGTGGPVEEFKETLPVDWGNFYDRSQLDDDFACRPGDNRLPADKCQNGDSWRAATVISDAVTILSNNFRLGYRNEGDYNLRNNAGDTIVLGYPFDPRLEPQGASPPALASVDETKYGIDLNGDNDATDTAVTKNQLRITTSILRRMQGFFDNEYLTSADWFAAIQPASQASWTAVPTPGRALPKDYNQVDNTIQGSSYVNNFVTPIQRRVNFSEYLMEMCPKFDVAECRPNDWTIDGTPGKWATSEATNGVAYDPKVHHAGTTVDLAFNNDPANIPATLFSASFPDTPDNRLQKLQEYLSYPRRVAFARDANGSLKINNGQPVPIGINNSGQIAEFPLKGNQAPRPRDNALWFRTTETSALAGSGTTPGAPPTRSKYDAGNNRPLFYQTIGRQPLTDNPWEQPLLVPVLQIHVPLADANPNNFSDSIITNNAGTANGFPNGPPSTWLPRATPTVSNMILAGGDSPVRLGESNGGLENFPRYLEHWRQVDNTITGSLIQFKRSSYASAPWQMVRLDTGLIPSSKSIFDTGTAVDYPQYYRNNNNGIRTGPYANDGNGQSPHYSPPNRKWGFDVALLSQTPDLFAQQFTVPPTTDPNEFLREVNRDDEWVQTLLCAKTVSYTDANGATTSTVTGNAVPGNTRPAQFCTAKAGGQL